MAEQICRSSEETELAGSGLAATLARGDLLLLEGELGAGKTTFVRGLARGLGCREQVQSPTFQLVRIYHGNVQLAHVDLYRLERTEDLSELGLDELLDQGVVVVEWGDRLDLKYPHTRRIAFLPAGGPASRDHRRLVFR
ncbi:MAG: tRNA (adenosine(37)-N6)-threonylcarbamoyltransferase complex ATPase subunit type 1 TsaE [Candidatus Dormibacteraeota bacterium]|nr:tRNA (adenosine(37)-N6)-threonylcarbamoyltransferase complex ATPase subunit type 1 TsaE [Candidatus Dormibacteraeota bacterium]